MTGLHPIVQRILDKRRDEAARKQVELWHRMAEPAYDFSKLMAKPFKRKVK